MTSSAQRKEDPADLEKLWRGALEELRHQMSAPAWNAWLGNTELMELGPSEATVGVPTQLAADWIAEHHATPVAETLAGILGRPVSVTYIVVEALQASSAKKISGPDPLDVVDESNEAAHIIALPQIPAVMEYNLSRHAIWDTQARRDEDHLEFQVSGEDIGGTFIIDYALGRLSVADMELVAWLQGRWDSEQDGDTVSFSAREYVRDVGASWAGWRAKSIRESLRRIHRTNMTITTWDQKSGKRVEKNVGIFADTELTDKSSSLDGIGSGHKVRVRLSKWLIDQLKNRQFAPLDWRILTGGLNTPLARRLYVFLEAQKGFGPNGDYSVTIDHKLQASLGVRDTASRHQARFRERLQKAGQEVVDSDPKYLAISIRPGKRRSFVLEIKRRPDARQLTN